MKLNHIALTCTVLMVQPAFGDEMDGLQNHDVQKWYIQEPCTKVIEIIDGPSDDVLDAFGPAMIDWSMGAMAGQSEEALERIREPIDAMMIDTGFHGMTFGFIMGFEAVNPNIRGDYETVLTRLRADCAAGPEKTAMEYLLGYAAE